MYINGDDRKLLEGWHKAPEKASELNYAISMMLKAYIKLKGLSYQTCNDIVGVLDSAKTEFHATVMTQYNAMKRAKNGPIYGEVAWAGVLMAVEKAAASDELLDLLGPCSPDMEIAKELAEKQNKNVNVSTPDDLDPFPEDNTP